MQKEIINLLKILIGLFCFLIVLVLIFFLKENTRIFESSEKNKLIKALKKDANYYDYSVENDFYKMLEGRYDLINKLDNTQKLSYERIDANNIYYESYSNSPKESLLHYSYSLEDDVTVYFFLNYSTNIRYKVTYYNSSSNYTCFKNDNNHFSSDCSYDFDIYITYARDVKKDFSNKLSLFDISLNKLKAEMNDY